MVAKQVVHHPAEKQRSDNFRRDDEEPRIQRRPAAIQRTDERGIGMRANELRIDPMASGQGRRVQQHPAGPREFHARTINSCCAARKDVRETGKGAEPSDALISIA